MLTRKDPRPSSGSVGVTERDRFDDRSPSNRFRKKRNPLALAKIEKVTFKDVTLLKYFVSERGRILPRRMTGVSATQQRMIARAVKQARALALLPTLRHE
jgi:small subunit ribosomal protein S18